MLDVNKSRNRRNKLKGALIVGLSLFMPVVGLCVLIPLGALAAPSAPAQLSPPELVEPADDAQTTGNPADSTPGRVLYRPLGVPCFRWESVAGATKYELQISEVPQETGLVLQPKNNLQQTTYCPTAYDFQGHGIQDGQTYYWRVRAYGGTPAGWGDWPNWRQFTRNWASAPTLLEPAATAVITRPPLLSWTPVDGAEYYKLEVSSAPDFPESAVWPNFTWKLTTRNTAYAMATQSSNKLPNDEDIYWRVRAVGSGNVGESYRLGPWSDGGAGSGTGREFGLCWSCNLEPELGAGNERRPLPLTPANREDHVNSAYFSWTPVEGAKSYDLEIHKKASFEPPEDRIILYQNVPNSGLLVPVEQNWPYNHLLPQIYWRVRAKNYYDVYGEWNSETPDASAQFFPEDTWATPVTQTLAPDLLFPEFYCPPVYNSSVWEDRTVAVPTFMWNQVPGAASYTIEVANNKFFSPIAWTLTTGNLSATPVVTEALAQVGVYYWRVRADANPWSQRWEARIDQAHQVFTPTAAPPRLVQPTCQLEGDGLTYGQQVLEHFPRLEWVPVSGASRYEVQIATGSDFASSLVMATETELASYTPVTRYPPDTYYWRVRAKNSAGNPIGGWSEVYHFALARQFSPEPIWNVCPDHDELHAVFTPDALLTEDPLGDLMGGGEYDLSALYTSSDNNFWYFGWAVYTSTRPVRFQLYLDPEGADGEGLDTSPWPSGGELPNDEEPYRPEYVLQWDMFGASGMPTVTLFSKRGSDWDYDPLLDIGGRAAYSETQIYSDTAGLVVLAVPHTAIGSPATVNCLLVSVNPTTTLVMDAMERGYVTVSTAPTPRTPPTSHVDEARHAIYPRMPFITWHTLTNIITVRFRSNVDVSFAGQQTEYGRIPKDPMAFSGSNPYYLSGKVYPDNTTHYWQILSRYANPWYPLCMQTPRPPQFVETTWSRPVRFTKRAQVPTNLTISDAVLSDTLPYVSQTPVFSWDPVQGAAGYRFELSGGTYNEPPFNSGSSLYVPSTAIPNGNYEWRVRIVDGSGNWSLDNYAVGRFQKGSDVPEALFPTGSATLTDTVYFRWAPLTGAAYYMVEVASDYNFSINRQPYNNINNTIYAPEQIPTAVKRGTFYWRVCGYNGSKHPMGCEAYYIERYPEKVYLPLVLRNKR